MYQLEKIFKKPAIVAFILLILFVSSPLSFVLLMAEGASVSAPTTLNLKFSVAPKNTGSLLGALAAKLVPNSVGMQIVVTGGSSANDLDNLNSHGSITCINGTNGNVIWQVDGYPVSIHQPFQIADLYNDGNYKIIVSLWDKTLVLNGKDGSVNWTSIAPSGNVLPAVADVNGDGYPEIFVSSGNGPYRGSDWITMLSHDGTILHQAYTWHPCYGGLTVGDPNGDGKFVLFSSDRSYTYADDADNFKGGGFGIRAFDAETLTPLWDYPTSVSSSHVPILADVNQDGKLDVIVGNQDIDGIEVLNAADGTVLGGRTGSTGMPVHLQPTVGDLDGDGHLEFLANNASQPKIWDLYSWRSKGALFDELGQPLITEDPPKAGNVLGGSFPDIIASAWSSLSNPYANQRNKVYIYEYNAASRNYAIVAVLSNISNMPSNFSLVTDVDDDGKNELVLAGGGRIYVYATSVPVPAKPARSNLMFYSEYNRGIAEYVAPPIPTQPVLKQEQPLQDSINQPVSPTLSIKAVDYQKQALTITFSTDASGTWRNIQTFTNVQSGVYSVSSMNMGMGSFGTTYNWRVSVTNNKGSTTTGNYRFTTYTPSPTQGTPTLVQNAGTSGKDLKATTSASQGTTTNIYTWYRNGTNLANLQLPFDSRTSSNPFFLSNFLTDDFENGLGNWNLADGAWRLTTGQVHSGSNSLQTYNGGYYLTSKPLDLSDTESITISFWYRTHGSPETYFMLWNGRWYDYLINLGSSSRPDEWQYYSVQTYDPRYLNSTFKVGFDAVGFDKTPITDQQNVWIDDFQISTTTKTKDYSGNNLNATVHGATWTRQGVVGGAYSFNGINNWISVPNTPLLGGKGTWSEVTAELWVNPSKLQNGVSLLAKKVASTETGSYMIGFASSGSSNKLYWGITSTVDNEWHELSASALPVNKWSFVVCTYKSGQGLTIYVNGIKTANLPLTGNIALGPDPFAPNTAVFGQPLFIGGDGTFNPNSWFAGLIDEVKIYPTSLTATQILQQYNDAVNGASDGSTISSTQINTGEVWQSKVTPNDSFSDGLPKLTNPIRVGYQVVTLNLTVSSSHGNPNPTVGITTYDYGSLITATVTGTAVENGITWTCTGWTGTGSVPSTGTGSSTTFMITADSTITWNWVQASNPSPTPDSPNTPTPNPVVATPTFSPPSGTYKSAQSVSIACSTGSSTIRYTTNGEEPTSSSALYTSPISVNDDTVTIKAKAFASGMKESSTASATYTIEESFLTLTITSARGNPTPSNGSYSSGQSITLSVSSPVTEDATIWTCTGWTGTGSIPATGSGTSVTFTITQDSTITWNWTASAATDQTVYLYVAFTVATLFILTAAGLLLKRRAK